MKPQQLVLLLVVVGSGLSAAFLAYRASNRPPEETILVYVPKKDIPVGTIISKQLVEARPYAKNYLPAQVQQDPTLINEDKVIDKPAKYHLKAGVPISAIDIDEGNIGGLDVLLRPGERAMTIPVTSTGAVSGFIRRGSHVDVVLGATILVRDRAAGNQSRQTVKSQLILEDMEVLAVGMSLQESASKSVEEGGHVEMVTLRCTSDQAQALQAASQSGGKLSLILRKGNDPGAGVVGAGATLDDVLAGKYLTESTRKAMEKTTKDDEANRLEWDPNQVMKKEDVEAIVRRLMGLEAAKKKAAPKEVEVAKVDPTPAKPSKLMKRIVLRDIQGNQISDVVVEADNPIAKALADMAEDYDPEAEAKAKKQAAAARLSAPLSVVTPPEEGSSDSGDEGAMAEEEGGERSE